MKCPNCGGQMTAKNNQFVCEHCGTITLRILDAKIDDDVDVMSAEEFSDRLEKSKRQFVVRVNQEIEVFDIDTRVINQRIKIASELLEKGDYDQAYKELIPIDRPILAVERLRYLAHYKVKNEYELSYYNGYVDGANYKKLIELCDEQSRATYEKIASFCRENFDARNKIKAEISEIEKLYSVNLLEDALLYAKEMCRKYPASALSWAALLEAKAKNGAGEIVNEWKKMRLCYDFYMEDYSSKAKKYVEEEYTAKRKQYKCGYKKTDRSASETYVKMLKAVTTGNYVKLGFIGGIVLGLLVGTVLFLSKIMPFDGWAKLACFPIGIIGGISFMFIARPIYGGIIMLVLFPILLPIAALCANIINSKSEGYNNAQKDEYEQNIKALDAEYYPDDVE